MFRSDVVLEFVLTEDFKRAADKRLSAQGQDIKPFWIRKYRAEACKNWENFYKRNQANFFKNRNYLTSEFPEFESGSIIDSDGLLIELGCGVGNSLLPLLGCCPRLKALGVDCSKTAVNLLRQKATDLGFQDRLYFSEGDISSDLDVESEINGSLADYEGKADFVLLMFVLSAIPPGEKQIQVIKRASRLLKPGGFLLVRDYAKYDLAELRFAENKLGTLNS